VNCFFCILCIILIGCHDLQEAANACRAGRYEVDGYVYSSAEEPKMLMTGKWNESISYQPCDQEGEPLPGTELKEVIIFHICISVLHISCAYKVL